MTAKRFFISLGTALLVLVAFNVFLALRVDSVPKMLMRKMRAMPKLDVLFVGNSLVQDGVDPKTFTAAWPAPDPAPAVINTGLSSTTPVEHFLMARDAYLHHEHVRCLVYGFYDTMLTKPPVYNWTKLVGNRAMGYAPEYEALTASLYAPGSELEKWRFRLISAVPMLRERSQLWKFVEIFRRQMTGLGMRGEGLYMFPLPTDLHPLFQDCEESVQHSVPFIPPVAAMLQLAHQDGTRVFIVEMPMNSEKRALIGSQPAWIDYRTYLQRLCQSQGIVYVDASQWVTDDADYYDTLHLGPKGAVVFSGKLAQKMAAALPAN